MRSQSEASSKEKLKILSLVAQLKILSKFFAFKF